MNPTLRAWLASATRRWHTNPDLCDTHDPVAAHQGRVALLLLSIYPDASRTLLAPRQLPVGALTALVGVPLFLLLMSRQR